MTNKDFEYYRSENSHTIDSIWFIDVHSGNPREAKVGESCTKIEEHVAGGEGDKWFYDIHYDETKIFRVFNPLHVHFIAKD